MGRRARVALLAAGVVTPIVCSGPPAAAATTAARPYDFDGDGRQELVASASGLLVGDMGWNAGGLVVLRGSKGGLPGDATLLTQATPGIGSFPVEGGRFGSGLASADFDRDGYADLAVAAPVYAGWGQDVGIVTIVPGSPRGLEPARSTGLSRTLGRDDMQMGLSDVMVADDLTGDGYADLAVGVPRASLEEVPGEQTSASGEVVVFTGGPKGLAEVPARVLTHQGPSGGRQDWDLGFGGSLGAGDLDGDGISDLVVGSVGAGSENGAYPGSVSVCRGAPRGPTGCTRLAQSDEYVGGRLAFAVARVTGGTRPDVVVGLPASPEASAGSVRILRLSQRGPVTLDRTRVLRQSSRGVPGRDEPGDAFGSTLAVGDLDRDGFADLVVGSPGEDEGRGRVTVVRGGPGGWRTRGNSSYGQSTRRVPGRAEVGDRFGAGVTLLDHDGDGRVELDIGSPGENGTGSVTTLRGRGKGFTTRGARAFSLVTLGVASPEDADFGSPLGQ